MERAAKKQEVANLNSVFRKTGVVVVALYGGLTVRQMETLRRQMKLAGASVKVAKNRLARIAILGTDYASISSLLVGQTLIATSSDPIAAPKVAVEFAKANEDFKIVGGAMGPVALSAEAVQGLATLPSLDELRSKIVGLLVAPATKLVRTINAPATTLSQLIQMRPEAVADAAIAVHNPSHGNPAPETQAGTSTREGPLTARQSLPSIIVKSLEAPEAYDRIDGIRAASRFLLSVAERDKMPSKSAPLSAAEAFEASTIPARLYSKMLLADADEARQAAYALVVSAPQFRGELDPDASPLKLDESQQRQFRSGLLRLLSTMKLRYFLDVDATRRAPSDPDVLNLHVKVKVTRRLPFTIGNKAVFLDEAKVVDDRLSISSPLADRVSATKTAGVEHDESGLVAQGEADMIIRADHILGQRVPIVVYFDRAEDAVNVEVSSLISS